MTKTETSPAGGALAEATGTETHATAAVAKTKRARRGRPRGRATAASGVPDILELRRRVGKLVGQPTASRESFAKLVGASHGSVLNWERGTSPTPTFLRRLREVARRLDEGTLAFETPRRGGRRGKRGPGRPAAPAPASRRAPRMPRTAAPALAGDVTTVYANVASVERGTRDARLVFGLVLPGARGGRAVADVLVPRELLDELAGRGGRRR